MDKEVLINSIEYAMDDEGDQDFFFHIVCVSGFIEFQGLLFYLDGEDIFTVMKQCVIVIIILFQGNVEALKI